MKEATGEVSMTVVTIVLIAIVLGIATALFSGEDSVGQKWITGLFGDLTGESEEQMGNAID